MRSYYSGTSDRSYYINLSYIDDVLTSLGRSNQTDSFVDSVG